MQYPVMVVEYDPKWPQLFDEEKKIFDKLFGEKVIGIEHVGSTAVPGLAAKPIVDIMIGVTNLEEGRQVCLAPLIQIGYHYVPELEHEIPERCFLYRGSASGHSHHVHITQPNTSFWMEHLLFRDYLRKYPSVAQEYGNLKHVLAKQYHMERALYTKSKTDFIEDVLTKARAEKEQHTL